MGRAARESENIVGTNIRAARLSANLTQVELADRVGVTVESLSRAERGTILPTVNTLSRVATVLGTTIDALAGRTQPPARQTKVAQRGHATDPQRARLERLIKGLDARSVRSLLSLTEALLRR